MPETIVVSVPVLWGGLMPVVWLVWAALLVYGLYGLVTGLIPTA
mgnify:CR=1 FL=1